MILLWLSIEIHQSRDCLPADGAEDRVLVYSHAAIGESAIYSVHGISCRLVGADLPFLHVGIGLVEVPWLRRRQLCAVLNEVLPFVVEIG